MKVLHVYKTYYPDTVGGVEQTIYQLARAFKPHGIEVEVFCLSPRASGVLTYGEHRVHRVRQNFQIASTGFSLSAFSYFRRLTKTMDLVHYHYPWPFMDLMHCFTRIDKPTVVTYHSDIVKQKHWLWLYRPLQKHFLNHVHRIIATSPNYLNSSRVLQAFKNKTDVIPIGLDRASYIEPAPERLAYWQERLGKKFFLFIGVLRYYKGLETLLQAAAGLPTCPIVLVGEGALELKLKMQAAALGLKHIHFLGKLNDEDKVCLLTLCFCFVFPSHLRAEAYGISLLEAAMFGKPLISVEIGTGTTYINKAGETGYVVSPGNSELLREAMWALWQDPQRAEYMGKCAQARYWKYFTVEKMAEEYHALYKRVCCKRNYGVSDGT